MHGGFRDLKHLPKPPPICREPVPPPRGVGPQRPTWGSALASQGRPAMHGSHWGYVMTAAGKLTEQGCIRCKLRQQALRGVLDLDHIRILPTIMVYPYRDLHAARLMIDYVANKDLSALQKLARSEPGHEFGFEEYLIALEEKANAEEAGKLREPDLDAIPRQTPHHVQTVYRAARGPITIVFRILRYQHGDAWGQYIFMHDGEVLSKAMVDLLTNKSYLTHHYPGKYLAYHLSQKPIKDLIDVIPKIGFMNGLPRPAKTVP